MERKLERLKKANELIKVIKVNGRKFFESDNGHNTRLYINDKGNIYYVDNYTGKHICIRGKWIHSSDFSHGGGLNEFIRSLVRYVRAGRMVDKEWLGQHWGYGEEIHAVRDKAEQIGFAG